MINTLKDVRIVFGLIFGFIFGLIAETFARLTLVCDKHYTVNFDYLRKD